MSTARGFPPPVPSRSSAYIIPAEDQPASRRRLYIALGGLAIGVGAGIGVLVSSNRSADPGSAHTSAAGAGGAGSHPRATASSTGAAPPTFAISRSSADAPARAGARLGSSQASVGAGREAAQTPIDAGVAPPDAGAAPDAGAVAVTIKPLSTVGDLMTAQHAAIARADRKALAGLIAPGAFGFGVDADEVAAGRDAVLIQLVHDLGAPPRGGFTVESTARTVGESRGHAWIAEQLDIGDGKHALRSFAITELAAQIDGSWQIVALHWAVPVDDATAERLAIANQLPVPLAVPDRHDSAADLDQAARAAFATRAAFADARSERDDAFNFGSGGERAQGGTAIKRIFTRLKAQLHIHDGVWIVGGGAWDPAQQAAPWIGWAALNVDYTARTRAAADATQTFRVLAILIKEAGGWRIVQTQWSNGGPIR
jgi:hypothetical protein